jgi:hypothetical protein
MSDRSSPDIERVPEGLADRIERYLDDAPMYGGHSDKAGGTSWELLREAMDELRASLQPATPTAGTQVCADCIKCSCKTATGGDAVAGDARALADRLEHAITTMQNDDFSKPLTEKRDRHAARAEAMRDVVDFLRSNVAGDVQAARTSEPDAWQYRMNVGGWLPWHEIDMPMDYFLKKHQIHLDNGSCEMRPLYLDAAQGALKPPTEEGR